MFKLMGCDMQGSPNKETQFRLLRTFTFWQNENPFPDTPHSYADKNEVKWEDHELQFPHLMSLLCSTILFLSYVSH